MGELNSNLDHLIEILQKKIEKMLVSNVVLIIKSILNKLGNIAENLAIKINCFKDIFGGVYSVKVNFLKTI